MGEQGRCWRRRVGVAIIAPLHIKPVTAPPMKGVATTANVVSPQTLVVSGNERLHGTAGSPADTHLIPPLLLPQAREAPPLPAPSQADNSQDAGAHVPAPAASGGALHAPAAAPAAAAAAGGPAADEGAAAVVLAGEGIVKYR